jgi:hypothetical protein
MLGMCVPKVEFPERYGGNIRVFMRSTEDRRGTDYDRQAEIVARESFYESDLTKLSSQIKLWRRNKRTVLNDEFHKHGKLPAKAFPARAAIPFKLLDLDSDIIGAVYEKPGSPKIGHYVPGTRIPIVSDDELSPGSHRQMPILNSAWHIRTEIERYLRGLGFQGRIIDIISQEDFSGAL